MSDCPWYGYLIIFISVLVFEAIYKNFISDDFLTSEMFKSFLKIISNLAKKIKSDVDGEKKCAYVVAAAGILSFLLIFGFTLKDMVGPQRGKDSVITVLLICVYIPYMLLLDIINNLYLSWVKKRHSN